MDSEKSVVIVDNLNRKKFTEMLEPDYRTNTSCVASLDRPHARTINGGKWQTIGVR